MRVSAAGRCVDLDAACPVGLGGSEVDLLLHLPWSVCGVEKRELDLPCECQCDLDAGRESRLESRVSRDVSKPLKLSILYTESTWSVIYHLVFLILSGEPSPSRQQKAPQAKNLDN